MIDHLTKGPAGVCGDDRYLLNGYCLFLECPAEFLDPSKPTTCPYTKISNTCIRGHNVDDPISNCTLERCKNECNDRELCKSIDYTPSKSLCHLNDAAGPVEIF